MAIRPMPPLFVEREGTVVPSDNVKVWRAGQNGAAEGRAGPPGSAETGEMA